MYVSELSDDELKVHYLLTYFVTFELFWFLSVYFRLFRFLFALALGRGCLLLDEMFLNNFEFFILQLNLHVCTFGLYNESVDCLFIFEHVAKLKRFFGAHVVPHFR